MFVNWNSVMTESRPVLVDRRRVRKIGEVAQQLAVAAAQFA